MLALSVILITSNASVLKLGDTSGSLKGRLGSLNSSKFGAALSELAQLDGPSALDAWQTALRNEKPDLRAAAWQRYRQIQSELNRKAAVPSVVRILAPAATVLDAAKHSGIDVTIWSSSQTETIAAVPEYLISDLRRSQINCDVLYDTIADWQTARSKGDQLADAITPDYQKPDAVLQRQVRIAVVDLNRRAHLPKPSSDWLSDPEDIVVRDGSKIAILDSFQSDGSESSIASHIESKFTRKGYVVEGYYTPDEFSVAVNRWFPGKTFNAGRPMNDQSIVFQPYLAEGRFHSYDETQTEFKALASAHPDLASYVKLGTSYEGRDIFALKISRNVGGDDPTKPDVLITGCHHAREWISVEPPVYFANQLVNGYANDASMRYLVDSLQIWIVPIVNPDGLTYSQGSPNDRMDGARTWRKNRRPLSLGPCVNSVGVDLNRNYNFQWRLQQDSPCSDYCSGSQNCLTDDIGASDDPRDDVYRGPSPESEPEIRALKALVDDPAHRFRAQIDYHNYAQLIMYPWSFEDQASPDASVLSDIANRMSTELRAINKKVYKPEQAIDLYPTTGSSADYAHGVNRVPAPFVVEMRPDCCNFNVPESDIDPINRENWAGAHPLLDWASGPPVLQAVSAFSMSTDGTLSNLVYSAHWVPSTSAETNGRELIVDTRLDRIQAGPMLVQLQFSKPMNTTQVPQVTLGRGVSRNDVTVSATGGNQGWRTTVYPNDTWVGETVIFQDFDDVDPWRLAVSAHDTFGLNNDGRPATIAEYVAGTGQWHNLEDQNGEGSNGGADFSHTLAPTFRDDFPAIFIASPAGGERFAGGERIELAWRVAKGESFDPASQKLFFSSDSGKTFSIIADALSGFADKFTFTLPSTPTTSARFRIQAIDRNTGNSIFGDSRGDFTIGANVGAGVDVTFVSSEKRDLSWSDLAPDGSTLSGPSRLTINLTVKNRGSVPIVNPFLLASQLTKGNILLSRDPSSAPAQGGRQSIGAGDDQILAPLESSQVQLVIGLVANKKFKASVQMFGVASTGSIAPSGAVKVWNGKPQSR